MTICIGALAQEGKCAVFAADRMVTAGFLSLEFEHQEPKVEQVKDGCIVMSSGDALVAYQIIEQLKEKIQDAKSIPQIGQRLYDILSKLSLRRAEESFLRPRGLDWATYRAGGEGMNPQLYMILDQELSSFSLRTDFLVVGVDGKGGHVISVEFPGTIQYLNRLGFGAVGSGVPHATVSLCLDGQVRNRNLAETLYAVYVSKKKAESAPGVGSETDIGIITSDGIKFLEKRHLESLNSLYNESHKRKKDLGPVEKICEEIRPKG